MRSAIVLAGGRSRRFGECDKALAPRRGTPMIQRVVERVAPVVDDVVINCRADQRCAVGAVLDPLDHRLAVDPVPDCGPVAGLRVGLEAAEGDRVAVVACDMPRADPDLFERLFSVRETAAVPRADGRRQPLHAVYDAAAARRACDRALADGPGRLLDVLDLLDPAVVDLDDVDADPDALTNVNTRDDLRALDARVRA